MKGLILDHREILDRMAQVLLQFETLGRVEIEVTDSGKTHVGADWVTIVKDDSFSSAEAAISYKIS